MLSVCHYHTTPTPCIPAPCYLPLPQNSEPQAHLVNQELHQQQERHQETRTYVWHAGSIRRGHGRERPTPDARWTPAGCPVADNRRFAVSARKLHRREPRFVTQLAVWVPDAMALIEGCRYDSCYPSSEVESHKIERLMGRSVSAAPSDHIVILTRVARTDGPPTFARWQSFASKVLRQWHPEETPPSMDELRMVCLHEGMPLGDETTEQKAVR